MGTLKLRRTSVMWSDAVVSRCTAPPVPAAPHYEAVHTSAVTVSSPLLDPLEGGPEAVAEVFGAARLDQLLGGDWRRRLALAAIPKAQRQGRGCEGALLLRLQLERLHAFARSVHRLEVVKDPERPVDDIVLDVALVRLWI